jgi:uncharacterized protein
MNYLDTSALVKRFVEEKGSRRIEEIVSNGEPVATAKIAYAEVYAGLTRKKREGLLSARRYGVASRSFEQDWPTYVRVDLRDEVLVLARDLMERRPLRGFDAIHLASALILRKELGEPVVFVAADARLAQTAVAERLSTVNPED